MERLESLPPFCESQEKPKEESDKAQGLAAPGPSQQAGIDADSRGRNIPAMVSMFLWSFFFFFFVSVQLLCLVYESYTVSC